MFKHCVACGQSFQLRPQNPTQSFCRSPGCQRKRRQQWQQQRLQSDPDYKENQTRAQKAWAKRNADYWKTYRESHPEYVERNRLQQAQRNAKALAAKIAKQDASIPELPIPSGIYRISLAKAEGIAKMDVWTVEIRVHACACVPGVVIAKR